MIRALLRSQFAASVLGGLVVAGSFLALGVTGRRTTRAIVEEAPVGTQQPSRTGSDLTPHAIYERDAPGVVFVKADVIQQVEDPFDLSPQREQSSSSGSGFLISTTGYILTAFHVIAGADRSNGVTVQFEDQVSRRAIVVGEDQNNDLALLKVDTHALPPVQPLELGDSTSVRAGDPTLAIGNPFGLDRTLTGGIVSALQRQIQAPNGFSIDNVIQTDAPINPGNSGGPLIDAAGRVIGINSQIETAGNGGSGSVGIAFAVPINTAKEFLPRLERGGQVTLAYLGVSGASRRSAPGVSVTVVPGGPAASAGVRDRDVIRAIDGRGVRAISEVEAIVAARPPGAAVQVEIRRGAATRTVKVVLGSRPGHAP